MLTHVECHEEVHEASTLLGEVAGTLWSSASLAMKEAYDAAGGVVYPPASLSDGSMMSPKRTSHGSLPPPMMKQAQMSFWHRFAKHFPPLRYIIGLPSSEIQSKKSSLQQAVESQRLADGRAVVVAAAFHPHSPILAIVVTTGTSAQGEAAVYCYNAAESKYSQQVLRHQFLQDVQCAQWKPHSKSVLAVGCRGGVMIWSLDFSIKCLSSVVPGELCEVDRGACVFYRTADTHAPVTSIAFTNGSGRFVACGHMNGRYVCVFDVSKPPCGDALIAKLPALEGGTSALVFSVNDRLLLRAVHGSCELQCWKSQTWYRKQFVMQRPVIAMAPLEVRGDQCDDTAVGAPQQFVIAFDRCEGVAVVQVVCSESTKFLSYLLYGGSIEMTVVACVSTSWTIGSLAVGGGVMSMAAHLQGKGSRLAVTVESGHVAIIDLNSRKGRRPSSKLIGAFRVEDPCISLHYCHGFAYGSLLALVHLNGSIRFVPSYYR